MSTIPESLISLPSHFTGTPPVNSLKQELPFSELAWENFERLCLRLAREQSNVESCRLYGSAGDKQEGIDIYARLSGAEKYTVYQCKREKEFGPKKIEEAVNTFLVGEWVDKCERFILCSQESLRSKVRQDEVVNQTSILAKKGITFILWDSDELSALLKELPQCVYDFFGIVWCEAFCGSELSKTVKERKPLPPKNKYPTVENYLQRFAVPVSVKPLRGVYNVGKPLFDLITAEKRIALLGAANNGKSTELRHLAFKLANDTDYFLYIVKLKNHSNESINEYIGELDVIPHDQIVVLLDGLDEVPSGEFDSTRRKIQRFAEEYPNIRIIVSCRTNFYVTYLKDDTLNTLQGFAPYALNELTQKQVDDYLNHLQPLSKESFLTEVQQKRFQNILYIPYYLIRLVNEYGEHRKIANNIVEITEGLIYDSIRNDVARYFPDNRSGKEQLIYKLLVKIAFILEYRGKNNCTWTELQSLLNESELSLIKVASSLLEGSESNDVTWSFTHNNIQEALAARAIEKETIGNIREIICFRPNNSRVKPTWTNTLSLLVSILDEAKRKQLIEWLSTDHLDLIIKFEPHTIDASTRFKIFKRIFESYTEKENRINDSKYGLSSLASFGKSDTTAKFLLTQLAIEGSRIARTNSLVLLAHYNIEAEFPGYSAELKSAIKKNIDSRDNLEYHAIRAYSNGFQLSEQEFDTLFLEHFKSDDTWTLSALYEAIIRQKKQEQYLKKTLEIIKSFILTESAEKEGRLADEHMLLRECVMSISNVQAVGELLDFLNTNYERVFYSIYFKELIDFALESAIQFKDDKNIYEKVKSIFISEDVYLVDTRNANFLNYFRKAGLLTMIFKDVYSSATELSRSKLLQLSQLAEPASLAFVVDEFRKNNISKDNVVLLQAYLKNNNPDLLLDFNKKINEIDNVPLPVFKDYQVEKQKQNETTKELLFDKDKFVKAVSKLFDEQAKEELTYDEIWNVMHSDDGQTYPPIIHEALHIRDRNDIINKKYLIERISRKWERFSIEEIYRFLKNDKDIELSDGQRLHIQKWCDKELTKWRFTEVTKKTDNGYATTNNAIYVSFFIRRFKFDHYGEATYLDMLSFNKWDDEDQGIFEFVQSLIDLKKIDSRVLSNLGNRNLFLGPFESHLEYIKSRNLKTAAPLLIPYIKDPDTYRRHETLECFIALDGDLSILEQAMHEIADNFRFQIIKLLIQKKSQAIKQYVRKQFRSCKDSDQKLRYAFYLIHLQDIMGIRFLLNQVRKYKEIPMSPDAPYSNFLASATSLKFLPWIFKAYRLGFRKEIKQDVFSNLQHMAVSALSSICLTDNNFPKAKAFLKGYSIFKKIHYFFSKNDSITRTTADLHFYFENIEQQYYINKGSEIPLQEAVRVYRTLSERNHQR